MGFLTGKTAIITGGGRAVLSDGSCGSIGYGIATAYAKEGANLVLTGRNVQKLEDAKAELESKYGIKVLAVQADVNAGADNESVVKNVVEQAVKEFGRIDVLINNAQASASGVTIADHTTAQFDLAIYSGLYAAFYYMQACYPYLKETKGSVINFASGAGLFGNYGQCAYAAAKEGIRGLTRVAATADNSGKYRRNHTIIREEKRGMRRSRFFKALMAWALVIIMVTANAGDVFTSRALFSFFLIHIMQLPYMDKCNCYYNSLMHCRL